MRLICMLFIFYCVYFADQGNCQIVSKYDPILVSSKLNSNPSSYSIDRVFPKGLHKIINENKIFSIYEDSVRDSGPEEYVTREIKILVSNRTNIQIDKELSIVRKYSFIDLPGLHLFVFAGAPSTPQVACLFNSSDSSLYYFGDCILEYSKMMSSYLRDIIIKEEFHDLILLYLNSLNNFGGYYIVEDKNEFIDIWNIETKSISFIDSSDTLSIIKRKEINEISDIYKKIDVLKLNYSKSIIYQVTLITWENKYGMIEKWQFIISDKAIELKFRKPLFLNKGPWDGLLRSIWD